ncbi:MAG TPA: peptidase E, partial [Verrucomicrobiae bacterium]|nr:peptidase E [Verrucomicrobiae bacterium]
DRPAPIHRYVLSLAGVERPNVCYVPTAGGDASEAIDGFYSAFAGIGGVLTHLSVFRNTISDVAALLREQHVIYVGGGNTRNLLLLWAAWGIDTAIRAAWERGAILAGPSAGGLCWFEAGLTDSWPGEFRALACLGWIPGSFCPHYDSEPGRRPVLERAIAARTLPPGYAVEDDAALHIVDGRLFRAVAQRDGQRAYAVRSQSGRFVSEALPMHRLGD